MKAKNIFFEILFPPICLSCQKNLENSKEFLCKNCFDLIKLNNTLFCPICRLRLANNKKICHHNDEPSYLLAAAANYDNEPIKNLIHYFKYRNSQSLAPLLSELILNYLKNSKLSENWKPNNHIIVPIPLHKKRERQRGYNQSKLIADFIAPKLNLKNINALKRIKNTASQASLKNKSERIENIKNCFEVIAREKIKNKNIILIDDIFTSGATISEAVKTLRASGARKITALVIAKA